jgi:hypothetical protein
VISGIRRDDDEMCALLGSYAALDGNALPTFWNNFIGLLDPGRWDDTLFRNVGKGLPLDAA